MMMGSPSAIRCRGPKQNASCWSTRAVPASWRARWICACSNVTQLGWVRNSPSWPNWTESVRSHVNWASRSLKRLLLPSGEPGVRNPPSRCQSGVHQRPDLRQMRREVFPDEPRWRNLLGVRLLFFSLAVLAVLVLVLLFLPSATVRVAPETQMQKLAISASASSKVATCQSDG